MKPEATTRMRIRPVMVPEALERTDWLEELSDAAGTGLIKPKIAKIIRPEEVADAQRLMEAGGLRRRPVLLFD